MSERERSALETDLLTAPESSGSAGLELPKMDVVRLLTSGLIALSHDPGGPVICLVGPGEIEGLPRAIGLSEGLYARLVTPAAWREKPVSTLTELGQYELTMQAAERACAWLDAAAMELACALRHPLEKRLARWLIEISDRLDGQAIPITQAVLGEMLSVRRTSISSIVMKLKSVQAIRSTRNNIKIDRKTLAPFACACSAHRNPAHHA